MKRHIPSPGEELYKNRASSEALFFHSLCPAVEGGHLGDLLGQDHRVTIPVSCMSGSLLLLFADTLSRSMGNGSALPVGAITSLLGAPFFIAIIFSRKENRRC